MSTLKKITAFSLLLLIVTSLILWTLANKFTPELLRDFINSKLQSFTHQPSQIKGDISWELFPRPRIKLTNLELGNSNFKPYHISLSKLFLNLKITPLLRGDLVFSEIRGEGFDLSLNPEPQVAESNSKSQAITSENKTIASHFAIERLLLSQGRISIIKDKKKLILSQLQFGAEQINLSHFSFPFQLKSNLEYINKDKLVAKTKVVFKGSASLAPKQIKAATLDLQASSIKGQLILQKTSIKNFKIHSLHATTNFTDNVLDLNPLSMDLYRGQSLGSLRYELNKANLDLSQTARNLDAKNLVNDLFDVKSLSGALDISIHSQSNLNAENWLNQTQAKGSITIHDGSLEKMNVSELVSLTHKNLKTILKQIKSELKPLVSFTFNHEQFNGKTPFILLSLPYTFNNNVLSSEAFFLETEGLRFKGSGKISVPDYQIDSQFFIEAKSLQYKLTQLQTLLGENVPYFAKGDIMKPTIGIKFKNLAPPITKILGNILATP